MEADPDPWSAPTATLHDRMRDALAEDTDAALATVVSVEGSAYRRPGAKMLVTPDDAVGAITAGCLEGPVTELAKEVLASGSQQLETYDLTDDDEWGLGMGCNGVIDVLVEPLDGSWREALNSLEEGDATAVCTTVASTDSDVPEGARAIVGTDGTAIQSGERPAIPSDVLDRIEPAAYVDGGHSTAVTVETDGGSITVFVDALEPPSDLLLFGWQRDVHPVARLGREVGFRVTVASGRGGRADSEDFPHADRVVSTRPSELAEHVGNPEYTYAVVMSHNFLDDRLALESLLEAELPYVGLMGPRKRFEELREDVAADGDSFSAGDLSRIATPVGLDIGGGEPAEIALSIVAEVLAVKHGRNGGRLTDAGDSIHPRSPASQR